MGGYDSFGNDFYAATTTTTSGDLAYIKPGLQIAARRALLVSQPPS